ncbi:zinc finger and BTB domain-containing protein 43-like protein [Lates japonicus]|uniref:Zinc finger and BTB domain-containing protein 43-like protein n=1 Tax=Lates japonicus TaxID=270547 RepID=A0AAD3MTP9_LATJO|nr:zinc finger and BTB domain-containing protein 43-like protein [Lates japonicus]
MDPTCSVSAAPAGLTVQVCFPGARAAVLDNLNRQREEGRLCDLSIQVQGQVFRAHRCVLAASSPYFHDQVLLKNVTTVSLPSVMDPLAFESVLSSAYTGQLSIVHDDIVNYVTVASFLQMWHIVDKCTEILKRPRPSVEVGPGEAAASHQGTASRQQSPSSTDCLNLEREGRRRERKPDALPPLATWRRPQQFPRWGRLRPSSAQHLADTQLDTLPSYTESDYTSCEEAWVSSHAKTSHFAHDGPGHNSRHHGGFPSGETLKQKVRFPQRGAPPSTDRLLDKNRVSGDSDETQEKRKNEKTEIEADEGVGEEAVEKKESFAQMGRCDFHPVSNENAEAGQVAVKTSADVIKEKAQRDLVGGDHPSDLPSIHACQTGEAVLGPSCPVSARQQWQSGPWSQQEQRPLEGEGGNCSKDEDEDEEEEDVDFECFTEGTFSRDTYDEIEDGTGQVSQRPLVPVSPDFTIAGSEVHWPSTSVAQGGSLTPTSSRHLSPSSAAFPPPSSPNPVFIILGLPCWPLQESPLLPLRQSLHPEAWRDRHVKMQHLNLSLLAVLFAQSLFKMSTI